MNISRIEKKVKQLTEGKNCKFLLTISGGADSVALLDIFARLGYDCVVAHCNFNLRGKESDRDEAYVRTLTTKYNIPIFVNSFQTKEYALANGISIEMSARDLRYTWFEQLRKENECDYIVVAHHMGDVAETMFINMLRGTGLRGLSGIAEKQDHIIRPLLEYGRNDILEYLETQNITHCEDSTNKETDFTRNKIRHNIIPLLEDINPSFLRTMLNNSQRIKEAEAIYLSKIAEIKENITEQIGEELIIDISKFRNVIAPNTVLYEILKDYNFSGKLIEEIIETLDGLSGKFFVSPTHKLVKDREKLIIYKLKEEQNSYTIYETDEEIEEPIKLKFKDFLAQDYTIKKDKNIACLDADKIKYPLTLRKWRQGDNFHPFGMKGKKKKLSDYFSDNKFSLKDKEECWILESDNQIMWIISHRTDERFKICKETKHVLEISLF